MDSSAAEPIPPALVRVALVSGFGSLILNLNSTMINVALERLIGVFHTNLGVAQWTVTGYLLALSLALPLFRFCAERLGVRRLYLVSLMGFTAASALCACAWSLRSLIVFRVLQGAVGGLLTPVAQTLAVQHAGKDQIGRMISIVAISVLAGPLLGPLAGGLLVQHLSWRWIFLVNLPLGALCTLLCLRYLPRDEAPGEVRQFDAIGFALLSPGLALLIYGVSQLRAGGSPAGILIGLALLIAFGLHGRRRPELALIDIRIFRQPVVAAALAAYVLHSVVMFGGLLLLPLYFQQVRGQSPLRAGLLLGLQGLGIVISLPRVGRLTDRYDPGKLAGAGAMLTTAGTLLFTLGLARAPIILLGAALVVRGVGLGTTGNPVLAALYRHLPKDQIPNATTALNIVQRMGGPLGTALMAVLLQWQIAQVPRAQAFTRIFAVNAALSALIIVSAAFLIGQGRPSVTPALSRSPS